MTVKIEQAITILRRWEETRVTENGTLLICHVPHVAPKAWLHELYGRLSVDEIKEYECTFPVMFPTNFKDFLAVANGANVFSDSMAVWGYRESYFRTGEAIYQPYDLFMLNQERPNGCPDSWMFFGSYSWDGTNVHFDASFGPNNSKVFRTARYTTKILNEWPSFDDWFLSEVKRLAGMFDEKGRKKNPEEPTLPPPDYA